MKSILDSYAEEFDDEHNQQDQESNIGLVIDGEVCKHLSADTVCAHLRAVCTGELWPDVWFRFVCVCVCVFKTKAGLCLR